MRSLREELKAFKPFSSLSQNSSSRPDVIVNIKSLNTFNIESVVAKTNKKHSFVFCAKFFHLTHIITTLLTICTRRE